MLYLKSLALWALIIPLAITNGAFREKVLMGRLSPVTAQVLSGLLLMLLIQGFAWLSIPWLGSQGAATWFRIGALWLLCTLVFEFVFGRLVAGKPWGVLLEAYTFKGGNLWPLVLLVVLFAPYLASRLR